MSVNITKTEFWNKTLYDYKTIYQTIEILLFSVISFFIPFVIGHPQILIGVIINFFLIRCAMHSSFLKTLPVILLPCLGVFSAGIIFGTNTSYLLYFIPLIWFANALFVLSYKYFMFEKHFGTVLTSLFCALLKSGFLFACALMLVTFAEFPVMFLTAMGLMQLITALIGYYTAVCANKLLSCACG